VRAGQREWPGFLAWWALASSYCKIRPLFKLLAAEYTIFGGKARFAEYAKVDKRIGEKKSVPSALVRPYAVPDKEGKEKYNLPKVQKDTFLKSVSKADIANFMLDAAKDDQWDGSPGVLLGGAKS
jgi:hypothetical protein